MPAGKTNSFEPSVAFLHCFSLSPAILRKNRHRRGGKSTGVHLRRHHDHLCRGDHAHQAKSPLCPGTFVWQGAQRNIQRGGVGTLEEALCSSKPPPSGKTSQVVLRRGIK